MALSNTTNSKRNTGIREELSTSNIVEAAIKEDKMPLETFEDVACKQNFQISRKFIFMDRGKRK